MTAVVDNLPQDAVVSLIAVLGVILAVLASGHAILYKRDSRAATAWVGFIWLVPVAGALVYLIFGVNRIRNKAALLRRHLERYRSETAAAAVSAADLHRVLAPDGGHLAMLASVVGRVVDCPLLPGNRVEPLVDGDEAYPAMLEAIRVARRSVTFVTYIFKRDEAGRRFAAALGEARRRGVEVRVLIDAMGVLYSWPSVLGVLRREDIRTARFLQPFASWHLMAMNMRTHRKILVVDGRIGFTGGMNIRRGHCLELRPPRPVRDVHFRVEGPVVAELQEVFADDWLFTTGESLRGPAWFPALVPVGGVLARGVTDGPDENFEKLRWTLLGAISIARRSVRIVTPYFLPDQPLISALNVAAMRGVAVDIILPEKPNLPMVGWASRALWWQVLQHGCRIWLTPPPFDHTKLMLVDGCWVLIGSANWDARSLRLNFEFNLECYDQALAERLGDLVELRRRRARRVTLDDVDGRALPVRLRDGMARLLTPYL